MARIALYVPDELKSRMDAVPDGEINWSDVARPALTVAVVAFEHRKGRNMSTAIERLRASKQQADQHDKFQGNAHGRAWAEHSADYRTLRALSLRRTKDPYDTLKDIFDPLDDLQPDEFDEIIRFPDESNNEVSVRPTISSDEYLRAFIDGAVSFFKEVRAEVEKEPEQEPEQTPKLTRRVVKTDD